MKKVEEIKSYVENLMTELKIARSVCITPTEKAYLEARLIDMQKVYSFIIKLDDKKEEK